eukprot:scaffold362107_cov18-Prasinocladus_malaysianus.AAC.1
MDRNWKSEICYNFPALAECKSRLIFAASLSLVSLAKAAGLVVWVRARGVLAWPLTKIRSDDLPTIPAG